MNNKIGPSSPSPEFVLEVISQSMADVLTLCEWIERFPNIELPEKAMTLHAIRSHTRVTREVLDGLRGALRHAVSTGERLSERDRYRAEQAAWRALEELRTHSMPAVYRVIEHQ